MVKPPPCLAAVHDTDLDPSIPAHHAELVKRGLASSADQHKEARKGAARAGTGTRLSEWRDA